ncbi:Ig-like domain-containing protein, partial [Rappaport israeli]|uniref:Ig-like domain-containing protein n=1 Tax=Rappaport israeli TaxID=1839807 RepID=UPI000931302E
MASLLFVEKSNGQINNQLSTNAGERVEIAAKPGEIYDLIDPQTGTTVSDIAAERLNDDLLIFSDSYDTQVLIKDFWNGECLPDISQCYAILQVPGAEGAVGEVVLTQQGPVLSHLLAGEIGTLGSGTPAAYLAGSAAGTASAIGAASTVAASGLGATTGLAALGVLGAAGIAVAASGGSSKKSNNISIEAPNAPDAHVSKDRKTVSGKAQPNSTIKIDTDRDGVADITTTADANGNFSVDVSNNPLRPGQNIDVTATDSAGNQSSNATITAPIDSTGSVNTGSTGGSSGSSGGSSQPSPQQPTPPAPGSSGGLLSLVHSNLLRQPLVQVAVLLSLVHSNLIRQP